MNKIAIITDSCTNLPEEYRTENVFIMPLKVVKDGVELLDGVEITADEVIRDLPNHDFKTALVSPGEIGVLINEVKEKGYTKLLVMTMGAKLSGTFNSFRLALEATEGIDYELVDTQNGDLAAGLQIVYAIDEINKGRDFHEVAEEVAYHTYRSRILIIVNTLDYIIKGGRIGRVSGTIGQLLNIKPVITVTDGILDTLTKARGKTQAISKALDAIEQEFSQYKKIYLGLCHTGENEDIQYVKAELARRFNNVEKFFIRTVSPAMSVHSGPELILITAYPVKE